MGEGYIKYAKKYYIFRELAWAVIICTLFSYFICISGRYATALKTEKDKAEKKLWTKEKESKRRAQEDLDKAAKTEGYIDMKNYIDRVNKKDKKKAAKDEKKKAHQKKK